MNSIKMNEVVKNDLTIGIKDFKSALKNNFNTRVDEKDLKNLYKRYAYDSSKKS